MKPLDEKDRDGVLADYFAAQQMVDILLGKNDAVALAKWTKHRDNLVKLLLGTGS